MNAKFKSLMYREWRVSQKTLFARGGLLIGWLAFMILAIVSGAANTEDITAVDSDGMTMNFAKSTIVYSAAIAAISALATDDVFGADLKTGWLRYSYTLPITPLDRAVSRFTRRAVMAAAAMLCSFAASLIICALSGETFTIEYVAWQFIMLDAVIAMGLTDTFILAARSMEDLKHGKKKTSAAVGGFYLILILLLLWKYDFRISVLLDDIMGIRTPKFGAGTLIISIVLLFVLAGAEFVLSWHFFKKAYSNISSANAKKSEKTAQLVLPEKTDGMTGLLYKEFKQNKSKLLFAGIIPFGAMLIYIAMHLFATFSIDGEFDSDSMTAMNFMTIIIGLFTVSNVLADVFKGDDKKLWAYFITSTPQGVKDFLYHKFVLVLAGSGLYMVSLFFEQAALRTYFTLVWNETPDVKYSFAVISFFILLFLCAVDIPFIIRFGAKKGSFIKLTAMITTVTVLVVVFGLLPEKAGMWIMDTLKAIYTGKANGNIMLMLSVLPYTALGAFLLSYKLSCKVFMKGVSEYDK